jgi:cysteinyl-tRNA synthetase
VSKFYEREFLDDLKRLSCEPAMVLLRVTDHVP